MKLTADQIAAVRRVKAATTRHRNASRERWEAIRAAEQAGVPRLQIANAAQMDKMTLWRRLEQGEMTTRSRSMGSSR